MTKNEIRIVATFFFLFSLTGLNLFAQKNPVEFSVFGGGGVSFFGYQKPVNKVSSIGYNCDIGVGFTGFISPKCGFHVGAGFGLLQVKAKVGNFKNFTPNLTDSNGYPFDLTTTLMGYNETHKTMFLNFPLLFQFQTQQKYARRATQSFYAMTGVKLFMLFNRSYIAQVPTILNVAYYPEFDNWAATQLFAGLGEFVGNKGNEKFGVVLFAMFTLETGIKWNIREGLALYTGVYFDCGLNDPTKKNRKSPSDYSPLEPLSLLTFYKKSALMDVGIKLRAAFYKASKKTSRKPSPCNYTY